MRKTLTASVMVLALCVPAFAGDMLCTPVVPPQRATAAQEPTTDGIIQNGTLDGDIQNGATDGVMDNGAAATFAQVLLNLLALS